MSYDPIQQRVEALDNQIQLLQQQKLAMQSYQGIPQIQQTFIQQPAQVNPAFDFNGKWVNNFDEVKSVVNNNLPVLIFDKSGNKFYMKQLDGTLAAYEYKEVQMKDDKDRQIDQLKEELDSLREKFKAIKSSTEGVKVDESVI